MRPFGIVFVILSALYLGMVQLSDLRRLSELPTDTVQREYENLTATLAQYDRLMTMPEGGLATIQQMRGDANYRWLELTRRKFRMSFWMPWLGIAGLGMILLSFLVRRRPSVMALNLARRSAANVNEAPPKEEYVDDWEFRRKSEGGFKTREDAVEWLLQDPLRKCDYCGAELKASFEGDRDAVQLVTYYKKVPEGAKDLRIVLDSLWFARFASELKCSSCERVIRR
ncbi:MAG TPA: hypothetical protein VI895_02240 [Bdellovibrionota bacterium]|nr:hypothetical protein [Bdellovibrionota bacterium]